VNEFNGDRNPNVSAIWFTRTSASADNTSYSDLESVTTPYAEIAFPSRTLPPIPVVYDDVVTDNSGMSGAISSEPQSASEILSDISPSAAVATPCSGLTSSARQLPSVSSELYAKPTKRGYYNCNITNAHDTAESGRVCEDSQSNSGISSTISPSLEAASYSGLTVFTREPSPTPGVYDKLGKHDYYNSTGVECYNPDDADDAVASGMIGDEPQSDTESLLSGRQLSEMEAVL